MWISLVGLAVAQSESRGFSAQLFRPAFDSRTSLWTERTTTGENGLGLVQILGLYTGRPLVLDDEVLISDILQTDLTGAVHVGRYRLGLHVPVFVTAAGPAAASGRGLGDLGLNFKGTVLRDGDGPLGLALAGHLAFPTARVDAPLGARAPVWELTALADKQIGRVVVAGNVAVRGAPRVAVGAVELDDQLVVRASGSYLLGPRQREGVSLDLAGQVNLVRPNAAGTPVEALLGGWVHVGPQVVLRGGVGATAVSGIGAAETGRVLLGVAYTPDPTVADRDGDTLPTAVDACPREAEDLDGWRDDDGCPDPGARVEVRAHGPDGAPLPSARIRVVAGDRAVEGDGALVTEVPPDTYWVSVSAEGYEPFEAQVVAAEGAPTVLSPSLRPGWGDLQIRLTDYRGQPIDGEWSPDGATWFPARGGIAQGKLPVGPQRVFARAEGRLDAIAAVQIVPGVENVVPIELGGVARVVDGRLEMRDVVRFQTASSLLRPEGYAFLDEVAALVIRHEEIPYVRVDGYTDDQGSASSNLALSQRRAASVAAYLRSRGVAGSRILVEGHGEADPVAPNDTAEGRELNRRVEITASAG